MSSKVYVEKTPFGGFAPITEDRFFEQAAHSSMGNAKISCFWTEIDGSKEPVEAYLVFYVGVCWDEENYNRKCEENIQEYLNHITGITGLKISKELEIV